MTPLDVAILRTVRDYSKDTQKIYFEIRKSIGTTKRERVTTEKASELAEILIGKIRCSIKL